MLLLQDDSENPTHRERTRHILVRRPINLGTVLVPLDIVHDRTQTGEPDRTSVLPRSDRALEVEHGRVDVHRVARHTRARTHDVTAAAAGQDRRHMVGLLLLARQHLCVHALDLRSLLGALLVGIRVLFEARNAVRDFWPTETREEHAGLDTADVHHSTIQALEVSVGSWMKRNKAKKQRSALDVSGIAGRTHTK